MNWFDLVNPIDVHGKRLWLIFPCDATKWQYGRTFLMKFCVVMMLRCRRWWLQSNVAIERSPGMGKCNEPIITPRHSHKSRPLLQFVSISFYLFWLALSSTWLCVCIIFLSGARMHIHTNIDTARVAYSNSMKRTDASTLDIKWKRTKNDDVVMVERERNVMLVGVGADFHFYPSLSAWAEESIIPTDIDTYSLSRSASNGHARRLT